MYFPTTTFFSAGVAKIGTKKEHEFDIFYQAPKNCKGTDDNPLVPGTQLCQNCYSKKLAEVMTEIKKSQRRHFIHYQVEQQEDKMQWLREVYDFVIDNERYLDEDDYSTSSDYKQYIEAEQAALDPSSSNSSDISLQDLLLNLNASGGRTDTRIKMNLTVPQLAFIFKLLYELKPDIFDVKSKAELQRFISAHFATKGTEGKEISTEKLKQLFSDPDPDAAKFWQKHLYTMIAETKKFY